MGKSAVALACLFAAGMAASAADAATFTFSFTAPFQNIVPDGQGGLAFVDTGDIGQGSGTITTGDPDTNGAYTIASVIGSFAFYDGDTLRTIADFDGGFGGEVGLVAPNSIGGYTISNIGLYDADGRGISFATEDQDGTSFLAVAGEVVATQATFTVTPQAADSAVPEPASWAMMVGGFGLIGAAMRRQRTAISFG